MLVVDGEGVEEDFAEEQRRNMRVALAQDMKRELIEGEHDRFTKVQKVKSVTSREHGVYTAPAMGVCNLSRDECEVTGGTGWVTVSYTHLTLPTKA